MDFIAVVIGLSLVAALAVAVYAVVAKRRAGSAGEDRPARATPAPAMKTAAAGLGVRLARTREALGGRLTGLFGRGRIDEDLWHGIEESLIAADVGVAASSTVVDQVRATDPADGAEARRRLREALLGLFRGRDRSVRRSGSPSVVIVVGVNGSGKTTSTAKLAAGFQAAGTSTLLGSADTFRAAADEQLRTWAERVGVEIVGGQPGADPAAVAFDAYQAARARGKDTVIIDTAGRLHSKTNLMQELSKVVRVVGREAGEVDEVLLVLDGTTGQNALAQARTFTEAVGVTGIVLTKLDGTARGGIAVAVEQEMDIPVKFIGVGEGLEDLVPFDPEEFVDALLGE